MTEFLSSGLRISKQTAASSTLVNRRRPRPRLGSVGSPARPGEPGSGQQQRPLAANAVTFQRLAFVCGAVATAIGASEFVARLIGVNAVQRPSARHWFMHVNTALAVTLLGAAILLICVQDRRRERHAIMRARTHTDRLIGTLGAFAALLGAATLAEYLIGADLRIDNLIASTFSAGGGATLRRPSALSATMMTLIGVSVSLAAWRGERAWRAVQTSAIIVLSIALLVLIGDVYDNGAFIDFATPLGTAVTAGLAFALLAAAVLCLRPLYGWMNLISGDGAGSAAARLILPMVLIGIPAIGYLRLTAQNAGLIDTR